MMEQEQPVEQVQTPAPVAEIEIVELPEEIPETPVEEAKKPFDPKTDKVEFNTPEQQEKFNYIYKQAKMSDARNAMLTDMLTQATKRLEDVESRFKKTDETDAERVLLSKVKAARDAGDDAAEISALNELTDFKVDKRLAPKPPTPPAVPPEHTQEFAYIANVVQERDASGNLARPWMNETHPDFDNTIETLKGIAQKYIGDPLIIPKSIAELDNIMRAKMTQKPPVQTRVPNPMQGGNLTNANQKHTIKLTRAELDVARKLGIDPKRYAAKRDEINKSRT
jgi:hypothetical protein